MGIEKLPSGRESKGELENCPSCNGTGKTSSNEPCSRCHGSGKLRSAR